MQEKDKQQRFVNNALKKGRIMASIPVIERISLMADDAGSITNGFNESFIQIIIRGMCWFHCKKAADRQLILKKKLEKDLK